MLDRHCRLHRLLRGEGHTVPPSSDEGRPAGSVLSKKGVFASPPEKKLVHKWGSGAVSERRDLEISSKRYPQQIDLIDRILKTCSRSENLFPSLQTQASRS